MKKVKRARKLLFKLPGQKIQQETSKRSWFAGSALCMVPEDVEFSRENVRRYYVKRLSTIMLEKLGKDDGLFCGWAINPDIPGHAAAIIVPKDIEIIRQLLSTRMLPHLKKGRAYTVTKPLIGEGVLSSSGPKWAEQRKVLDHGFVPRILGSQFDHIVETVDELSEKLLGKAGEDVEVLEEMLKTTLDVLGRVGFSYDIKGVTSSNAPLYEAFDCILSTIAYRARQPLAASLSNYQFLNHDFNQAMHTLESTVCSIIEKRKEEGIRKEQPRDLLDVMLASYMAASTNDKRTENKLIIDNIKTILFAGHDVSDYSLKTK